MALVEARCFPAGPHDGSCDTTPSIVPPVTGMRGKVSCTSPASQKLANCVSLSDLIGGLRTDAFDVSAVEIAIPTTNEIDDAVKSVVSHKYAVKELLALRPRAAPVQIHVPEVRKGANEVEELNTCHDEKIVLSTKRQTNRKVISFHTDLEVDIRCTVNAYNLDPTVEWPNLHTFCSKTVGVSPMTIRMMRRSLPAQALMVFRSPEDAQQFMRSVPSGAKLKGRKPRFELSKASKPAVRCTTSSSPAPSVVSSVAKVVSVHTEEVETAIVAESEKEAQS